MKARLVILIILFFTSSLYSKTDNLSHTQIVDQKYYADYKNVVNKILKDDELFVMFYMNLALIVDPNREIQVVEQIETENPWESLRHYLDGKSNIYFCPSGKYLNVAIEYMACPSDPSNIMSYRYGMYRLSSPDELFKNRGHSFLNRRHKAVVLGGLDYDFMTDKKHNLLAFRGYINADGYTDLINAYDEAIYIDSLFRRKGIEVALLNGQEGCEQSFYEIPSSNADILHIASHGE